MTIESEITLADRRNPGAALSDAPRLETTPQFSGLRRVPDSLDFDPNNPTLAIVGIVNVRKTRDYRDFRRPKSIN